MGVPASPPGASMTPSNERNSVMINLRIACSVRRFVVASWTGVARRTHRHARPVRLRSYGAVSSSNAIGGLLTNSGTTAPSGLSSRPTIW